MADYRYYVLREDGRIASGTNIEAPSLDAVIRIAHEACGKHPTGVFRDVEIWSGRMMVYSSARASMHFGEHAQPLPNEA
jgi:hypothetical protein